MLDPVPKGLVTFQPSWHFLCTLVPGAVVVTRVVATVAVAISVTTIRIAAVGIGIFVSVSAILAIPVLVSCGFGRINIQPFVFINFMNTG